MIKAVIIDDEQDSRESLHHFVTKYCDDVEVMGFGENVKTGIKAIKGHNPQLVFLDVEMPFGNGFDLLEQIGEVNFEVIFVTAFSQYAMKALNLSASYYILKPVDIDELINAVDKAKKRINDNVSTHTKVLIENIIATNKQEQKIILPLIDGFEIAYLKDVIYLKADDNFTSFHLRDGSTKLICRTLKHYEETLNDCGFCRIHRSTIVNLNHITKYNKGKGGYVTLNTNEELEVSPSRKNTFLEQMGV